MFHRAKKKKKKKEKKERRGIKMRPINLGVSQGCQMVYFQKKSQFG
jgi:hypothetical protein